MGGIDIDMTNQIDFSSDEDGLHLDWDILNSITPLAISVDGDVDFSEGADGFLELRRLRQPGPGRSLPADPGVAVPARRLARARSRATTTRAGTTRSWARCRNATCRTGRTCRRSGSATSTCGTCRTCPTGRRSRGRASRSAVRRAVFCAQPVVVT